MLCKGELVWGIDEGTGEVTMSWARGASPQGNFPGHLHNWDMSAVIGMLGSGLKSEQTSRSSSIWCMGGVI